MSTLTVTNYSVKERMLSKNELQEEILFENYLDDFKKVNFKLNTVKQDFAIGPFTIHMEVNIDFDNPINSYFDVNASVSIPLIGTVTIVQGRMDKNNTKIEASISSFGAAVVFDIDTLELYVDLFVLSQKYHISLWKF